MQNGNGVLIINKHKGCTSHDIVNMVRRIYNTKQVGHAGTLDPDAEGVLVVLVGNAAKACEYLSGGTKKYRALMRLGVTSDTEDASGILTFVDTALPDKDKVFSVVDSFLGKSMQTPPMYSALKVGGQKLCDLARDGKVIERAEREIEIFAISAKETDVPKNYILDIHCSGGTYIRTICADIGQKLGCGGIMSELCRVEACGFDISQAVKIDTLKNMSADELPTLLIPTESLFADLSVLTLEGFYEKLCKNGCEIYQKKIGTNYKINQRLRLHDSQNRFFALGEVRDYPDGSAVKAIKFFE